MKSKVIFFFTLLLTAFFFIFLSFYNDMRRVVFNEDPVTFNIESGSSVSEIADVLQKRVSTISPFKFKLAWYLRGQVPLKAGIYEIEDPLSLWDLIGVMEEGQVHFKKVLLPEGLTLKETAIRLEEAGVIKDQDKFLALANNSEFLKTLDLSFASSLEGFLFPDTYFFSDSSNSNTEEEVLIYLVHSFWQTIAELTQQDLSLIDKSSLYNTIKLASIVEKEYREPSEAPLIASVFLNRIKINMRLESCATLVYVLKEIMGRPHPERILWQDTEIESPYNTYRSWGLPPTPISNPGRIALKAALYPEETTYLFFVVKDSQRGTHTFTKDFSDHSQARKLYLQNFTVKG